MESNWRFNVWDIGMWGSSYELAASISTLYGGAPCFTVKLTGSPVYPRVLVAPGLLPAVFDFDIDFGHFPPAVLRPWVSPD